MLGNPDITGALDFFCVCVDEVVEMGTENTAGRSFSEGDAYSTLWEATAFYEPRPEFDEGKTVGPPSKVAVPKLDALPAEFQSTRSS
jgi:hypothetical protein